MTERLFVNWNKRTVITDVNPDWIIGHTEERKDESSDWTRSLHSDWVFARIGDRIGPRAADDPEQFAVPTARTGGLVVGEPGDSLQDILRWPSNVIGLLDMVGLEADDRCRFCNREADQSHTESCPAREDEGEYVERSHEG